MVKFLLTLRSSADIPAALGARADILGLCAEDGSAEALRQAQNLAAAVTAAAAADKQRVNRRQAGIAADSPALSLSLPFSVFAGGAAKQAALAAAADSGGIAQFYVTIAQIERTVPYKTAAAWGKAAAFAARYPSFLALSCGQKAYEKHETALKALEFWLAQAHKNGFIGLFLACSLLQPKNRLQFIRFLGEFLQKTRESGLQSGLIGGLQLPDIPRLLPYQPDYLGFSQPEAAAGQGGATALAQIRSSIPFFGGQAANVAAAEAENSSLGTDKILVADFIVPMHIGAYAHEKGAAQRVCFNVAAEIIRLKRNPHLMSDVFSYDIILDAIERLAAQRHIELVEALAEQLAAFLLGFARVRRVTVRVEKLDLAPRAVGIEITRSK